MSADDQLLWALFQQHVLTCPECTPQGECWEGHRLLMAWGRADALENEFPPQTLYDEDGRYVEEAQRGTPEVNP